MAKVAFLGLGVMGGPMARHLAAKGHDVTVYNRTTARAEAWVAAHGGRLGRTPSDAARGAELVFACVGNDDDLRHVCTGDGGAFAAMAPGTLFVDHTTVSAQVTRELAGIAAGQGIGLGINLGVAPSGMVLPAEAVDWLAGMLEDGPEEVEAVPEAFHAPKGVPDVLLAALDAKLARAGGLASGALLAGVTYRGGRRGHMLAFLDAVEGAQGALARAAREALAFSGLEAGEMDVAFLRTGEGAAAAMARVALRFDLPEPVRAEPAAPIAPGSDPAKPPKLR